MKVGDTVRLRGLKRHAVIVGVTTTNDARRARLIILDRNLRGYRTIARTWLAEELVPATKPAKAKACAARK